MKAWKKGAIIGGVWGFMFFLYIHLGLARETTELELKRMSFLKRNMPKILLFPAYLTGLLIYTVGIPIGIVSPIYYGGSILIGALIGASIGHLIDKHKNKIQKRN